jgi:hypothetical protein
VSNSAEASAERSHLAEPDPRCERCGNLIDHSGPLCAPCDDDEYEARMLAAEANDEETR